MTALTQKTLEKTNLRYDLFHLADRCIEEVIKDGTSRLTVVLDVRTTKRAGMKKDGTKKEGVTLTDIIGAAVVFIDPRDQKDPLNREEVSTNVSRCLANGRYLRFNHVIKHTQTKDHRFIEYQLRKPRP